ncbi:uncharacterized protein [Rutidosis leptorrhynchoides]|uniref:uncharacterized protein n=1 Tax=Rutidosis leptorrhynchoides TaxID=125765 RepID=UPI003A9904CA
MLITGLQFGKVLRIPGIGGRQFRKRVFAFVDKKRYVLVSDLIRAFERHYDYADDDVVRICLLLVLVHGFIDSYVEFVVDDELLRLVEDLNAWNSFPWGSYVWHHTFRQLSQCPRRHVTFYPGTPTKNPVHGFQGFIQAFKIWIFEVLPFISRYATKDRCYHHPRILDWKQREEIGWVRCEELEKMSMESEYRPSPMVATSLEIKRD